MTLLLKALHMLAFSNRSKQKMVLLPFISDVCDFDICLCDFNPVSYIWHDWDQIIANANVLEGTDTEICHAH